jgi:hypothetical protein
METKFDKIAWSIAAVVLLAWAIGFGMALIMATWPPQYYYPN